MKKYKFTFSNGAAQKNTRLDFDSLCKGEQITIEKRVFSQINIDQISQRSIYRILILVTASD